MRKIKNVSMSGALGALLESGQIRTIKETGMETEISNKVSASSSSSYKTDTGIQFNVNELVNIDPKKCEPWKYANRLENEFGNMDEFKKSIKQGQQQPALARLHHAPHNGIEYEIIFGRRRFKACLELGLPLLVILKNELTDQEAVFAQKEENTHRENLSLYSEAIHYKALLDGGIYKSSRELANHLRIPSSTLNDLLIFTRIPNIITEKIPNLTKLTINMAKAILSLLNDEPNNITYLKELALHIGASIATPQKLQNEIKKYVNNKSNGFSTKSTTIVDKNGRKLFTLRKTAHGAPCIVINKDARGNFNLEKFVDHVKKYFEQFLGDVSGIPDKETLSKQNSFTRPNVVSGIPDKNKEKKMD